MDDKKMIFPLKSPFFCPELPFWDTLEKLYSEIAAEPPFH
jgi:hypothetical protein